MQAQDELIQHAIYDQLRKSLCEEDFIYFTRYFFKKRFGEKMIISGHHLVIAKALMDVLTLKTKRLIINVPPGYTKTELAVINFMAYGLAINSMSKFMHLSYSDSLALENSDVTRNIVKLNEYQNMWEVIIKKDNDSKKKWWTKNAGGVYAAAAGGQVTGFRAGKMIPNLFAGALIIDDPHKSGDIDTEERIKVLKRFLEVSKSRLALEDTPIIIIMQRLHKRDLSGFLLRGGSKEMWNHLNLPVIINKKKKYNPEYTHGIPIKHNLPDGWLWPLKHGTEEHKRTLKASKKVWHGQYMQSPEEHVVEGALWTQKMIDDNRITSAMFYEEVTVDKKTKRKIIIEEIAVGVDPSGDDGKKKGDEEDDGSIKKKDNDEIGIVVGARCTKGHYYILADDSLNGSPLTWGKQAIKSYVENKCNTLVLEMNFGGELAKSNIQKIEGGDKVKIKKVSASRGKMVRADPISALYELGKVHHVGSFELLEDELTEYTGQGKSPNRFDGGVWVLTYLSRHSKSTKATAPKASPFQ